MYVLREVVAEEPEEEWPFSKEDEERIGADWGKEAEMTLWHVVKSGGTWGPP